MTDEKFSLLSSVVAIAFIFVELIQFSTHVLSFLFVWILFPWNTSI